MFRNTFVTLFFLLFFETGTCAAASLDIGFNYSRGVSEERGIDVSFSIEKSSFSLGADFRYSKLDRDVSVNNGGFRVGYDSQVSKKWFAWTFNQSRYDRVQKINFENFFGGGPKYLLKNSAAFSTSLSIGILQHHVDYEGGKNENLARLSARHKMKWQISKSMNFKFVGFYQPDISSFSDYIVTGESELGHTISEKISVKMKVNETYRSVTETKHNDIITSFVLSVNF